MRVTIIFFIFACSIAFSAVAGHQTARFQEESLIIDQSPGIVVLRIYGDYVIATPFDKATKQVETKFYILKLSELGDKPLTLEKVGPLKVKESSTTAP